MLKTRLSAFGSIAFSLILWSLGSNIETGAEAYYFPNLIAILLFTLGCLLFIKDGKLIQLLKYVVDFLWRWMFGIVGQGNPARWPDIVRLIPMFSVIFLYLAFADIVGLYTSSFISFFLITMIYTPARPRSQAFFKNLLISIVFMVSIYFIFSTGLQLQTPSTWLI